MFYFLDILFPMEDTMIPKTIIDKIELALANAVRRINDDKKCPDGICPYCDMLRLIRHDIERITPADLAQLREMARQLEAYSAGDDGLPSAIGVGGDEIS